jgi:hypothetical protein
MKKLLILMLSVGVLGGILGGCSETPSSDQIQQDKQEKMLQQGTKETGMPTIVNFQERKELKTILEARDTANLITYLYTQNSMDGKWVYQGEAIGFPIPYSTEYTNPTKVDNDYSSSRVTVDQADPNGLFSSQSTQADWIMAINPKTGKPEPMFCEPNIVVKESKISANLCESWSLPSDY